MATIGPPREMVRAFGLSQPRLHLEPIWILSSDLGKCRVVAGGASAPCQSHCEASILHLSVHLCCKLQGVRPCTQDGGSRWRGALGVQPSCGSAGRLVQFASFLELGSSWRVYAGMRAVASCTSQKGLKRGIRYAIIQLSQARRQQFGQQSPGDSRRSCIGTLSTNTGRPLP